MVTSRNVYPRDYSAGSDDYTNLIHGSFDRIDISMAATLKRLELGHVTEPYECLAAESLIAPELLKSRSRTP